MLRLLRLKTVLLPSLIATLLPTLFLSACSSEDGATGITIESPWVRETPPGRTVAAGYFGIRNNSSTARTLVAAHSAEASRVEMHTMAQADGMMRMRQVESIEIPADSSVSLQPGGLHLMLFDIESAAVGHHVPMTLTFDDGWQIEVRFPVRRPDMQEHQH